MLGRNESYGFTYATDTTGTLDRAYEGDTATAAAYQLYQNVYALPDDYAGPVGDAANQRLAIELRYCDHASINAMDPARRRVGEPFFYAEASPASDGTRQAELYPVPQFAASYPFRYVRALARYAQTDTAVAIPAWISIPCLMAGVRADLGQKDQAAVYEYELSQMRKQDASARGVQKLRMAPVFARHRMERSLKYNRMRLP